MKNLDNKVIKSYFIHQYTVFKPNFIQLLYNKEFISIIKSVKKNCILFYCEKNFKTFYSDKLSLKIQKMRNSQINIIKKTKGKPIIFSKDYTKEIRSNYSDIYNGSLIKQNVTHIPKLKIAKIKKRFIPTNYLELVYSNITNIKNSSQSSNFNLSNNLVCMGNTKNYYDEIESDKSVTYNYGKIYDDTLI